MCHNARCLRRDRARGRGMVDRLGRGGVRRERAGKDEGITSHLIAANFSGSDRVRKQGPQEQMKRWLASLVLLVAACGARAYEVENGEWHGFKVTADNLVWIATPDHRKIQVTNIPFVAKVEGGGFYSIPPIEPIRCTWDPSHTWLGIFITVRQVTEAYVFNLKTETLISRWKCDYSRYPAWFGEPQWFTHTRPIRWSGNRLFCDSLVRFKSGGERHLPEVATIHDDWVECEVLDNEDQGETHIARRLTGAWRNK